MDQVENLETLMAKYNMTPDMFMNCLKHFAAKEIHENTMKLMCDQYKKENEMNDHDLRKFCLSQIINGPTVDWMSKKQGLDIQITEEQVDKILHIFTTEQMLELNDQLHNGVTWF